MSSETTVPTTHRKLVQLGRGGGGAHAARRRPLVRRLGRGVRPALPQLLVEAGTFTKLSDAKRPNCYLARSDPGDVARVEDRTFICSADRGRRRPDQQLARPGRDARDAAPASSRAAMRGRTMYVVPFSMGPLGSPIAHIGVELTDSAYVAVQHADHDPHGPGARSTCSAPTASSCRACTRSARRSADGAGRRAVAVQQRRTSTSCTSPRRARSGRTARATAATRCSARSASRCASRR